MSLVESPIELATSFESAMEIITKDDIRLGADVLKWQFKTIFQNRQNVCLAPVMQAGVLVGRDLASQFGHTLNPIRMSYYKEDGIRLDKPVCKSPLDVLKVVDFKTGLTKPVVFTEAVVDSQGTLLAAMDEVRNQVTKLNKQTGEKFAQPEFYVFALLSKINGESLIPNFNYAYYFHPDIWAFGYGCDADGKGRKIRNMMGYKSPFAERTPLPPYYSRSALTDLYLSLSH